jgi:hypothetical protein
MAIVAGLSASGVQGAQNKSKYQVEQEKVNGIVVNDR